MDPHKRPLRYLWDVLSGYGYRPEWSFGGLVLLIALASWGFHAIRPIPTSDATIGFQPVIYATDLALPLIDLRLAGSYAPSTTGTLWLMWLTVAAGWLFSGAFVAAVTGVFKSDD